MFKILKGGSAEGVDGVTITIFRKFLSFSYTNNCFSL